MHTDSIDKFGYNTADYRAFMDRWAKAKEEDLENIEKDVNWDSIQESMKKYFEEDENLI